ncbi:hypothetical protein TL16_g00733 [Triparma laevis f. inornata]|uniref:Uncharacterized protein n=1 Tax=Triparma laevis f. inornata TaxID=1714386 RepID=A0A9W7DPW2_9STRA|nr:hypothetical protein TL16_g00733 [Triparma laevis f. inornata]
MSYTVRKTSSTFTYPIIADHPAGGLPTASSIQLVNAGASGIMEVKADGCKMHMLAMDGVYRRTEIEAQNELILLPATRAEIALECRSAGSYVLRTERNEANDVFLGSDPEERMDQDLISLSITAAGGEHWEILDELPELPPQLRVDLGDSDVKVEGKQHTITMGGIGIKRPRTDRRREILLDNTISNFEHKIMDKIKKPNICHPFHIHINHFQVQDVERNEGWFVDKEEEEEEKEGGGKRGGQKWGGDSRSPTGGEFDDFDGCFHCPSDLDHQAKETRARAELNDRFVKFEKKDNKSVLVELLRLRLHCKVLLSCNNFLNTNDFRSLLVQSIPDDTLMAMMLVSKPWLEVADAFIDEGVESGELIVHVGKDVNADYIVLTERHKLVTRVIFLLNITTIGEHACKWAENLVVVDLPKGIESISWAAFSCCTSLTSISFPTTLTSIGEGAFAWCSSLDNVDLFHTNLQQLDGYAFADCSNLKLMTIPDSLQKLGDSVFLDCVKLVPSNIDVSYSGYDVETTSKVVAHLRSLQN